MKSSAHYEAPPKPPLFPLGHLSATPAAIEAIPQEEISEAIARHARGDWGDLDLEDTLANKRAPENGGRIVSAYQSKSGTKFWIVTEAVQYVTTIQLPEED